MKWPSSCKKTSAARPRMTTTQVITYRRDKGSRSAPGILIQRHLNDLLRTDLLLDDDRNLLTRAQLCQHRRESHGGRGRPVVHGFDRVAGPDPGRGSSPAGGDRADQDAVP